VVAGAAGRQPQDTGQDPCWPRARPGSCHGRTGIWARL